MKARSIKSKIGILTVLFTIVISSSIANAYVYAGYKWPGSNTLYKYRNTVPASWQNAIYSAAGTWNGNSKFSLYESSSASNVWGATSYGSTGPVGVTAISYSGSTIVGCNADFNTYFSFSTSPSSSQYDVQSVALHEFGHWLTLNDLYSSSDSAKTMYGYASEGQTKRSLSKDDIDGIVYIYGK